MTFGAATLRMFDAFLFIALPYAAFAIFFIGTIARYRSRKFTYSSLSSQLLENRQHFWALVPFHYGILAVLAAHVVAFLLPGTVLAWNSRPLRLYVLEVGGLVFGILALVGLVAAVVRRIQNGKLRVVTSKSDWVVFGLLLFQLASGIYIAVFIGWGSSWFAAAATPYLRSLLLFQPDIGYLTGMPWAVRLHIINAFVVIAYTPFTRLVHILVVPNHYLWRRPQVVRWNLPRAARNVE